MEFRLLRADEIEARVATVSAKGCQVLLFKDARCDMNILDETVGAMNWQRSHTRDNANCTVSLWDEEKKQWISKEDTGTESNTEREKGLASDSFKRACFNWGIGRELYTAPFIWFPAEKCRIGTNEKTGKPVCYGRFRVDEIRYAGKRIAYVRITNTSTRESIEFGDKTKSAPPSVANATIGQTKSKALEKMITEKGVPIQKIFDEYKVHRLSDLTEEQHASVVRRLNMS